MSARVNRQDPIAFYLPFHGDGVTEVPAHSRDYWPWLLRNPSISKGKYSWTLQTYLQLAEAGVPCRLRTDFPSDGVVVSHRDFLPVFLRPRPNVFLVCIKPDRKRHTWSQFYVVQNSKDRLLRTGVGVDRGVAIPYWPQPGLVPRKIDRGDRCENVAYLGRSLNLAPELQATSWSRELEARGFNWAVKDIGEWHDYSAVDAMVAIRTLSAKDLASDPVFDPDSKPPSKLVNAWLAGVPAIVGRESAYRSVRRSDLDFIEVGSTGEVIEALERLRRDKALYQNMVSNGIERSRSFTVEAIRAQWQQLLCTVIQRREQEWRRDGWLTRLASELTDTVRYFSDGQNVKDAARVFFR